MKTEQAIRHKADLILFDGVCNLCEWSVRFVIRHDPDARFQFAPLQSDIARIVIEDSGAENTARLSAEIDSFVLIQDGDVFVRSEAWLRVCRQLSGWPSWLKFLRVVPGPIRDWVYDFVGRHRYRWFGEKSVCLVPTADITRRFLK
jgi:predicted DCC family thiol-disulfide oxidoreductase YuxK